MRTMDINLDMTIDYTGQHKEEEEITLIVWTYWVREWGKENKKKPHKYYFHFLKWRYLFVKIIKSKL